MHNVLRKSTTTTLLAIAGIISVGFAPSHLAAQTAPVARVTMPSHKSFDQTVGQLKSSVGQGGMMIMAEVNQGKMLSMTGLSLKATLFLIGNPTVGKQILEQDHAAGLYVPLRVYVYEGSDGHTYLSYDRPSALLAQLNNAGVSKIAGMLDQKLEGLTQMATR